MLQRLREGYVSEDDWALLSTRALQSLPLDERREFNHALRLFTTRARAAEYNRQRVYGPGVPVASMVGEHSDQRARMATPDTFRGLSAELSLAVGAKVMYKTNSWVAAGLVNGQIGTVRAIVYANGVAPPALPRAVIIVEFPNYKGPVGTASPATSSSPLPGCRRLAARRCGASNSLWSSALASPFTRAKASASARTTPSTGRW